MYSSIIASLLISMTLVGCAGLPTHVERPVSTAMSPAADTPLARIADASTPEDQRELSGFRLLVDGDHALNARIALIRRAQKSIDVQYYQIASDAVGFAFLRELRDAAARGVRVRLLVDDLYAAGQDELFAGLAAQPNVELRLFNPLPARSGGFGSRLVLSMHEFERINHRMHNKLFIADNTFAVAGGRNIANEYFMRGESANFIDADVLASGPVVRELSAVFDAYWNSEQVYPVQSLAGSDAAEARALFDMTVRDTERDMPVTARDRFGRTSVQAQLDSGHLEQSFAAVKVFADAPTKVTGKNADEATPLVATRSAMRAARSDLLIVSPYFVPGQSGMSLLQEVTDRHVRLTVVTNSFGATDEPLVHWGYARYRHAMLKMGVAVHEITASVAPQSASLGDFHSSLARLHAKVAVIDQQQLFIGSMNMDARSARLNTEMVLLIDSPALSAEVASLLHGEHSAKTYRLRVAGADEHIEWVSTHEQQEVVQRTEPGCGLAMRLKLATLSAFVNEGQL